MRPRAADSRVRLAEVMAALSIATDLGMGKPSDGHPPISTQSRTEGLPVPLDAPLLDTVLRKHYRNVASAVSFPLLAPL